MEPIGSYFLRTEFLRKPRNGTEPKNRTPALPLLRRDGVRTRFGARDAGAPIGRLLLFFLPSRYGPRPAGTCRWNRNYRGARWAPPIGDGPWLVDTAATTSRSTGRRRFGRGLDRIAHESRVRADILGVRTGAIGFPRRKQPGAATVLAPFLSGEEFGRRTSQPPSTPPEFCQTMAEPRARRRVRPPVR